MGRKKQSSQSGSATNFFDARQGKRNGRVAASTPRPLPELPLAAYMETEFPNERQSSRWAPVPNRSGTAATFQGFMPGSGFDVEAQPQKSAYEVMQDSVDLQLQRYFGGCKYGALNFLHKGLVITRLALRSGPVEERYYNYCHLRRKESYEQTFQRCNYVVETQDEIGQAAHSRHLLMTVLPTSLPTNLPTNTSDKVTNETNREINASNEKTNQANGLLEQKVQRLIRQELSKLKAKGINPRGVKKYKELTTMVLFAMQDPDVRWVRASDAGITAGLLLETEIILFETYGFYANYPTALKTIINLDGAESKVTAAPAAVSVFSSEGAGDYLIPRARPLTDAEYQAAKKSVAKRAKRSQKLERSGSSRVYHPGAVDDTGVQAYDEATDDTDPQGYDQGAAADSDDDVPGERYHNEGRDAPSSSDDEAAPKYDAADDQSDAQEDSDDDTAAPRYDEGDEEGTKAAARTAASSVVASLVRHSLVLGERERGGSNTASNNSSDVLTDASFPSEQTDSGASVGGYIMVRPGGDENDVADDDGEQYQMVDSDEEDAAAPKSSQAHPGSLQLKQVSRRPTEAERAAARVAYEARILQEQKPLPSNPFIEAGQSESDLLPNTLYASLMLDIRKALRGEGGLTLADCVRDLIPKLEAAAYGDDSKQLAMQICARLACLEMPIPGANYLGGLGVTDAQYSQLFTALCGIVSNYRMDFAAEEGSVASRPKERVSNDNMANIEPFMAAFIDLYLHQLAVSLERSQPFQFSILSRAALTPGKEVKDNIFVVIKQGKSDGRGFTTTPYELRIKTDPRTNSKDIRFVRSDKTFSSQHEVLRQENESFGDDPLSYTYKDKKNREYRVTAAGNVDPSQELLAAGQDQEDFIKRFKESTISQGLSSAIIGSAIQRAYNEQKPFDVWTETRRWMAAHPKTLTAVVLGGAAAAAAAAAYGAGLFSHATAPCQGYIDGQGVCSSGNMPNPQCSLVADTTNVLAGGVVKITPACSNLAAFQASSSQFVITNIPAGSQLSVNSRVIISNFNATSFDATPYMGQQVSVQLPAPQYGFYGDWTPTATVAFASGSQSFTGPVSAPQAVHVEPVPGTATVTLSQGSFNLLQNGNTTFTLNCAPAQGDSNVNVYISNLPIGDTLTWRAINGTLLQFTATSANNGTGTLPNVGFNQQFTYIPARDTWGTKGFSLSAKSVAGGVEAATASAPLNLNYRIQGVPSPVVSINAPSVVNTVQGQYSTPFNLTATPANGNTLVQQVVLQPGASLCDVASSNCLTNNGAQAQTFSIPSTWGISVQYRSNANGDGFSYLVQDTLDGLSSVWSTVNVGVNQLLLPVVSVTQGNSSAPVTQLSFNEDTAAQFKLNVNFQNAANATVILQFPTITAPFAGGVYTVNATSGTGFPVVAQVQPGQPLDVSNLNLGMPIFIAPPANVNRGNQNGNLNVGVQVTSQASNGLQAVVSSQVGLNIRPVADPFTFMGRGAVAVAAGATTTLYGTCQANVPGEVLNPMMSLTAPPNQTFYIIVQPPVNPSRYPPITNNSNVFFTSVDSWNNFGLAWRTPVSTPAPATSLVNVTAIVDDYGDELSQTIPLYLNVNPRP